MIGQSVAEILTARLSGRRLFVKVFLWFWLTVLLLLTIFIVNQKAGNHFISRGEPLSAFAAPLANEAVRAYESGGAEEFQRFAQSLMGSYAGTVYLIDGSGRDIASRPIPRESQAVIRAAPADGQIVVGFGYRSRSAAFRITSPSGHAYVLLSHTKFGSLQSATELGLPLFMTQLFIVTLFCFWLAHHIVAPIQGIQGAARKVATGDLSIRAPVSIFRRHDELAELAEDFDSMVERIGALVDLQRNLLNMVSHELRSPLARFNVSLALLRKNSSAESEPLLQRMEREVERIDVLLGQLLTLMRLEGGISSREWGRLNFSQLVQEVAADGNFEAQSLGKSVRFEAETQIDIFIERADQDALRSACENVVRNAIRFTAPGSEVEVTLGSQAETTPLQAVLSVRDHGPGIPDEFLNQIFRPFFRVKSPTDGRRLDNGTGLGLAIAVEAIRQHRGSIVASNRNPDGLEVKITLPMDRS